MPRINLNTQFFKNNYNTSLTPEQQQGFNQWIQQRSAKEGRDVSLDQEDYDLQGFYAKGGYQGSNGHLTDEYKKPNHPTFSDQSVYNGALGPNGEKFKGGTWGDDYYAPSPEMLKYGTHTPQQLQEYMRQREPDYHLVMPQ